MAIATCDFSIAIVDDELGLLVAADFPPPISAMKRKDLPTVTPPDPDQIMIAGIAPVSMGERLGWLAEQPMQPRREQRPLDIGFWNPMRNQIEMF